VYNCITFKSSQVTEISLIEQFIPCYEKCSQKNDARVGHTHAMIFVQFVGSHLC